jgi:hypothetical protein
MKVVHVLKRIEMIDNDIKDLKKLEKSIASNKSFSTPIYMSIEKQINILLGERIKMLELTIANPPESLVELIEGRPEERHMEPAKKAVKKKPASAKAKPASPAKPKPRSGADDDLSDDDDIPMLTQDMIDARMNDIKGKEAPRKKEEPKSDEYGSDDSVKILDIALEKGTLSRKDIDNRKDMDKDKKVRFFRENFPTD